jgi:peptidylprolyl isomerase
MKLQASVPGTALAAALGLATVWAAPALAAPAPAATAAPAYAPSDWKRLDPENLMVIDTSKGRIVVELRPELSAEHVARIKQLTRQGFYDNLKFFRVIDEFMAQTGDKDNTGAGDAGFPTLKGAFSFRRGPETPFSSLKNPKGGLFGFIGGNPAYSQPDDLALLTADGKVKTWGLFCYGVAGMARTDVEDSASTQFFLMRQNFPRLDDSYTPWGRVVAGLEVVRAIAVGEPPANPDTMLKVRIAADIPAADRPDVWRVDTMSAAFKARMAQVVAARGADFTPCDVEVPSEIRK